MSLIAIWTLLKNTVFTPTGMAIIGILALAAGIWYHEHKLYATIADDQKQIVTLTQNLQAMTLAFNDQKAKVDQFVTQSQTIQTAFDKSVSTIPVIVADTKKKVASVMAAPGPKTCEEVTPYLYNSIQGLQWPSN